MSDNLRRGDLMIAAMRIRIFMDKFQREPRTSIPAPHEFGGARRDRTDDLLLAKQALSQLSYGPAVRYPSKGGKWWAWEDLNFRPHAYQARALTN